MLLSLALVKEFSARVLLLLVTRREPRAAARALVERKVDYTRSKKTEDSVSWKVDFGYFDDSQIWRVPRFGPGSAPVRRGFF